MVNIVVPKNSVHDIINLALTIKELQRERKRVKCQFISEKRKDSFWRKLSTYVDEDKSLVILDMPHPDSDALKQIGLEPWEAAVLYIPSELNALTNEEREIMIEKGISVVPYRKTFECFLGDISDANEMWRNLSKIISMEEKPENIDDKEMVIAKGIIEKAISSPRVAIKHILEDNFDYFLKIGNEKHPNLVRTGTLDAKLRTTWTKEWHLDSLQTDNILCFLEVKSVCPRIFGDSFETYMKCKVDPIVIRGAMKALFTVKPTFFLLLPVGPEFVTCARFGKGALLGFDKNIDDQTLGYFLGVGRRSSLLLKVTPPRFISFKTLQRRLLGGKTSQQLKGKRYEKIYRGLKDRFTSIEFVSSDKILVPEEAFENTIALLHQSGVSYQALTNFA